ncbi:MAG: hypothetical protein J6I73_05665 [Treponema sp.]|nr:hypothetical protein [Treponema sp.]
MKKRNIILFFAALVFGFMSCKSTPKEEPIVEQPVVPEPSMTDSSAALEVAKAAREAAIAAGADAFAPEQLGDTDSRLDALSVRSSNGENVDSELADVTARYNTLEQYAKAIATKNRIDELDFAKYAQSDYDAGNESLNTLLSLAEDSNAPVSQMLAEATAANMSFSKALFTAFRTRAREERTAAFTAKRNADSVYAAVAEKTRYDEGVQLFRDGDASYAMQDVERAYNNYTGSHATFEKLFEEISEKRALAQQAIDEAKARVAESAAYAAQADNEVPLEGDDIKGIEDVNAVLLEETAYDDPEKAAEELPETIIDTIIDAAEAAK